MQISFKNVNYTYDANTPYERTALKNISFDIDEGSYTVIIGKTGSGKSTLIEHFNGLLVAREGEVTLNEYVIKYPKNRMERKELAKKLTEIRKEVSVLFQFSEQQLFETTVEKDIMFAPLNYGMSEEDAKKIATEMINLVGLNSSYLSRSPFELSGGEMRKVALAGVLALKPKVLILDEPTIALDYKSKKELMELVSELKEQYNMTIILVSHNMDYTLQYADKVIVMGDGQVKTISDPVTIFATNNILEETNLLAPEVVTIYNKLKERGVVLDKLPRKYDDLLFEIKRKLDKKNG